MMCSVYMGFQRSTKKGSLKTSVYAFPPNLASTPLDKNGFIARTRRAISTGHVSAVHLHLKDKCHSFKEADVHILDRENRPFERGVTEVVCVHLERPSLNCLTHTMQFPAQAP